ncbi:MAG: hypothetical protein ACOYMF_06065 [Bacteroidales bacterium]
MAKSKNITRAILHHEFQWILYQMDLYRITSGYVSIVNNRVMFYDIPGAGDAKITRTQVIKAIADYESKLNTLTTNTTEK